MSVNVVSWVWENSRHSGTALLLLLAIADNAHDDGGGAYPGIRTLAKKARMSERNTHYGIKALIDSGALRCDYKAGPHGVNVYTVVMEDNAVSITVKSYSQCKALQGKQPKKAEEAALNDGEIDPNIDETLQSSAETLQSSAPNPAIAIAPDPLRSVIDPSVRPAERALDDDFPLTPLGVRIDFLDPSQIPRWCLSSGEGVSGGEGAILPKGADAG